MVAAPFHEGDTAERDEARLLRDLRARPDFLNRHPSLYMTLAPPARPHGEAIADHMAAMIGRARTENAALRTRLRERTGAHTLRERVEDAVLALLRAAEPRSWIESELASTLGLDSARLSDPGAPGDVSATLARRLLGGGDVRLRDAPTELALLHGAASPLVRSDAILRVEGRGGLAVLALGSREPDAFSPAAAEPLRLLGRAVEAALDRA